MRKWDASKPPCLFLKFRKCKCVFFPFSFQKYKTSNFLRQQKNVKEKLPTHSQSTQPPLYMNSTRETLFFTTVFGFLGLHVVHAVLLWAGSDLTALYSTIAILFCIFYSVFMYVWQVSPASRIHKKECPLTVTGEDVNDETAEIENEDGDEDTESEDVDVEGEDIDIESEDIDVEGEDVDVEGQGDVDVEGQGDVDVEGQGDEDVEVQGDDVDGQGEDVGVGVGVGVEGQGEDVDADVNNGQEEDVDVEGKDEVVNSEKPSIEMEEQENGSHEEKPRNDTGGTNE